MFCSVTPVITLLFVSNAYAVYFGGIVAAPFKDPATDSVYCPAGTVVGSLVVWCCPSGTVFDNSQNGGALCCPTSADCTNDLLNSGIQCADPSMTLWKEGGSMLCCPSGYYLNDLRICDNTGSPNLYTTTEQSAHLTPEASSPSGTAAVSSPASQSAAATTDSGKSKPTATSFGGATVGTGSQTRSGTSAATSKAAAANLDKGLGGMLAVVGGLLFL